MSRDPVNRVPVNRDSMSSVSTSGRARSGIPAAALVAAVAMAGALATFYLSGTAAGSPYSWRALPLDDAWIHQVYGRSVATGHPFQYNPGEWEVGATSPLWAILLAPGHWMGSPVAYAKLLGVLLVIVAAIAGARIVGRLAGPGPAVVFAALLPAIPYVAFADVSGMEVSLFLAVSLLVLLAVSDGGWKTATALAGLVTLVRPEGWIALPLVLLAFGISVRTAARPSAERVREGVLLASLGIGVALPWVIYCLVVGGHLLPATVSAKSHWSGPDLGTQLKLLGSFLGAQPFLGGAQTWTRVTGGVVGVGLILLGIQELWRGIPSSDRTTGAGSPGLLIVLVGWPLLHLAGMAAAVPLGADLPADRPGSLRNLYFARYLLPAIAPLFLLWCSGLGAIARRVPALVRDTTRARVVAFGSSGLAVTLFLLSAWPQQQWLRSVYSWNCRNIEEQQVAAAEWVATHVPAGASVFVSDAGAIRYFGEHRVVDLVGLNTHRLLPLVQAAERAPRESPEQQRWQARFWEQEQPRYFAVTRGWHGPLLAGRMMSLLQSIQIDHNTICAGSELVILQATGPRSGD